MISSVREYHDRTGYDRHEMTGHFLDWGNQPEAFKVYFGFDTFPLSGDLLEPECSLSDLASETWNPEPDTEIDEKNLARILLMAHAVTATARHRGSVFHYRSVASAGALYPFELYVAVFDVPGVDNGLYHHDAAHQRLTLLRAGNALADLGPAVKLDNKTAPVLMFFLTSIFYRSSWKYRDRAYRYCLLDSGHLAENLALALRSGRSPFTVCYDFEDELVNRALGLDPAREVCLAVVPVWGKTTRSATGGGLSDPKVDLPRFSRIASREIEYPVIQQAHTTTSLVKGRTHDDFEMDAHLGVHVGEERPLSRPDTRPDTMSYKEAVLKRRSMRNFVPTEMSAAHFTALVAMLCARTLNSAGGEPAADTSVSIGFLAGNVEGLVPGFYMLHRERETISLVAGGFMLDEMTHACLGQSWLANCAVHFLFLSNLDVLERSYGTRGYRYAMLAAGRFGQRIYLAATAMKLGCCGIGAFYDKEAARLLGLNDLSKLLYLVAVGPVKKYRA